ncbi:MAG: ferrous iron transport protein A [Francisellaceae bacterium]|jgi:Fe2+ transport system protein FeoA|nr:ferrous iron transport protein A [Francisellaceae bacterium]MBT6208234.1 ferrous iron transport protein A [Francisellaceae bacterium]MBT6537913.1 ferrous iron transport protein A [Francisellaceae bacterium]
MANLADLKVGQKGTVTKIVGGSSYYRQRLISEGLIPGAKIMVQWIAPLGDPFIVRIEEDKHSFSLRKPEANILEVDLDYEF